MSENYIELTENSEIIYEILEEMIIEDTKQYISSNPSIKVNIKTLYNKPLKDDMTILWKCLLL